MIKWNPELHLYLDVEREKGIFIKRQIYQGDIILSMHALQNISEAKAGKTKGKKEKFIIIFGDMHVPFYQLIEKLHRKP